MSAVATQGAAPPPRLAVAILWHMHQPQYRDAFTGEYVLPWTYLHAIKDYVDMAAHLEQVPGARAVVNFTPVLLEQIDEYSRRIAAHLGHGAPLGDAVLACLTDAPLPTDPAARAGLLQALLRANRERLVERHAPFAALAEIVRQVATPERAAWASDALIRDLAVWYHLAWLGETVRREDPRVAALESRSLSYSAEDRRGLLELIGGILAGVLPRYRALAQDGRVELAVTPYGHPILPLLFDLHVARESQPGAELPRHRRYPGGPARAAWHVEEGLRVFERHFGFRPTGCWPAEGAVHTQSLQLLESAGFSWAATSANVLRGSLGELADDPSAYDRPWRIADGRLRCFFRHDHLSDAIGFEYSRWHGDDAAAHLAGELGALAERWRADTASRPAALAERLVLIALDGENAWEHFPYNGYWFLRAMYAAIAADPRLELVTLGEFSARGAPAPSLAQVTAGSWVHGTLSTWIGDPQKNAAWDLLCDAKLAFDAAVASGALAGEGLSAAEQQLALCESSDWFWWFGDYNPADAVHQFDELFRRQLKTLYRRIGTAPPAILDAPIAP
ncbi:MAG: glycoside hydrolase family 57 protein [Steroidobacteraceae bacterium]